MRCTPTNQQGFTLIEVMIIAPVVILVISGFVALLVSMIGDSLVTREQNTMVFETQDALDRIEQDTRLTSQFLVTSKNLVAPQGSDSNFTGTQAFSNTNSLILGALTTDKNPTDPTRQLVYYASQPNVCGPLQAYNRVFQAKVIYFIKDSSLWRRMVLPDHNQNVTPNDNTTCSVPWQRNTCSPGYNPATRCQTNDIEVMKNIDTFTVKYLSDPASSTDLGAAQALSAKAIEVAITGKKQTKGREVTSSGTIRATKLNNIDVDLPIPTTPQVTGQATGTSATFSWPSVPAATSYYFEYNRNGGAWTGVTLNGSTTSYSVNANRNETISVRVTAKNNSGDSPYGTAAVTIPPWYACNMSGWEDYGVTFANQGYTKTSSDVVFLKGVIKNMTAPAADTVICELPTGYRPSTRVAFQTYSGDPSTSTRIDILTNGQVRYMAGQYNYLSLDGIRFVASTASYSWQNLTLLNSWEHYNTPNYGELKSTLDSMGRAHIQGVVKRSAGVSTLPIATLPVAHQPEKYTHFPARGNSGFNLFSFLTNIDPNSVNTNTYYSLQAMYYPASFTSWTPPSVMQNNWTTFDTGHPAPAYTKSADGVVTVKGLVKKTSGTANGTTIFNLPAGYRPAKDLVFATMAGHANARVDVRANGDVVAVEANAAYTALNVISFMAEQ